MPLATINWILQNNPVLSKEVGAKMVAYHSSFQSRMPIRFLPISNTNWSMNMWTSTSSPSSVCQKSGRAYVIKWTVSIFWHRSLPFFTPNLGYSWQGRQKPNGLIVLCFEFFFSHTTPSNWEWVVDCILNLTPYRLSKIFYICITISTCS